MLCKSHVSCKGKKVKVTQSCPALCDCMNYTVHGILQARLLEWVAILFSKDVRWNLFRYVMCINCINMKESYTLLFSCVQLFMTPWTAACQAPLPSTVSQSLLKFMCIELVMLSNHLILFCPLILLPSNFPSIWIFSIESALCIRWPKYWSFWFSINSSNGYSGLISFRMDWFDLLAVQGTLKSFQHSSSKVSILQHSAFFMVEVSHPCMIDGKTIALSIGNFVIFLSLLVVRGNTVTKQALLFRA